MNYKIKFHGADREPKELLIEAVDGFELAPNGGIVFYRKTSITTFPTALNAAPNSQPTPAKIVAYVQDVTGSVSITEANPT